MTEREARDYLRESPIPHRADPLQVMDMTMIPAGMRGLFDESGLFVGGDVADSRSFPDREQEPQEKLKKKGK